MKAKKTRFIIFILTILMAGCSSTTLFRTTPSRADVYVSDQKRGKTPYYYTDRKISGSSTPITFKKEGFNDLNIILKRNEDIDIGPIIGGFFVYVPLLWIMKYDTLHTYEMERVFIDKQIAPNISDLNDTTIANIDTIKFKQNITKEPLEVSDGEVEKNDSLAYEDQNELQNDQKKNTLSYFGFGGGFCLPGSVWGLNYTFISSSNWGGSIRLNTNIYRSKTVPDDYYDDNRSFVPKDYVNTISFNIVRSIKSTNKSNRFGIEFGPSWVIYRKAEFTENPAYSYTEEYNNWFYNEYRYEKSHPRINTIGGSIRATMGFFLNRRTGLELGLFTNINSYNPVYGIEFNLLIGRMEFKK